MSRKGCEAAPAIRASTRKPWGCFAALSRHKAAPTKGRAGLEGCAVPVSASARGCRVTATGAGSRRPAPVRLPTPCPGG
ncbi:hypothetical protein EFK07_05550 [Pseudomonas putida]|uniref:Uncharacterized protein n=1 Tax=Pseudomonas putida TaxID=303 RepID=A0A3M8TLD7_PSEPU|nr:hypothetical protein EFK07_05550 [Pseudomonas putida]